jgi:hypothetical protein
MERLALIEVFDFEGRYQHAVPVEHWPVTVGRALDCDLVLNDPHVAAHHATLDLGAPDGGAAGRPVLTVGQTRNGVRLSAHRSEQLLGAGASAPVPPGAVCHIGRSSLRVRLAADPLADEEPIAHAAGPLQGLVTVAGCVAVLLWLVAEQWLQNEPGAGWDKYVPPLLATGIGVVLWSALWGLGSKIFQRHFHIVPHLRVVLAFLLISMAADLLLLLAAYALSLPLLSHLRGWVEIAMVAGLLAAHVSVLLPGHERTIRVTFAALCVAVLGINGALSWRHHQRLFDEQFAGALPPPALRLAPTRPPAALLSELRSVRGILEKRAREDEDNDTTTAED